MAYKTINNKKLGYWKEPQKPYPKKIWWEVIAPRGAKLSILQEYDVVFDDYDMKIRQLPI